MTRLFTLWNTIKGALRASHEPENARLIAEFSWRVFVIAGLIAALAVIGYGIVELQGVTAALGEASAPGPQPQLPLDRGTFEAIVSGFSARAARYQSLAAQPLTLPDPSQ